MQTGSERLARDVDIIEEMSGQMAEYMDSDVMFWPMSRSGMPMLTLGGYLMREHRLNRLAGLLSPEIQARASTAISHFNQVLSTRVVRFEAKAQQELQARLRQWEEYLKDVERGSADRSSNYETAVETRAMIAALIDRLSMPPYQLDERPAQHLSLLDTRLQNAWQPGDFIWPEDWAAAYPQPEFWWLYGTPRTKNSRD